jgi:nucleoside-diphosphate-sugar epimerase
MLLGAGGKMGPSLAVLARRAAEAAGYPLEVIAASRFSNPQTRAWLEQRSVRTISCDLLDPKAVVALPPASDVISLIGLKFGTSQNPAATWATNTLAPPLIADRYPEARIVALSTGNVYPLSSVAEGGAVESDPLTPLGEYANAAVARERIFEYLSERNGIKVLLLRLFYAVELRYGVLRDLADKVWNGEPIDLANGFFNCIWQGDANEFILRSLPLTQRPATALNLTSTRIFSVSALASQLGEWLGREPHFVGRENATALVGNATQMREGLGEPPTPMDTALRWTAAWVQQGGRSLGKPTHFEVRDGNY